MSKSLSERLRVHADDWIPGSGMYQLLTEAADALDAANAESTKLDEELIVLNEGYQRVMAERDELKCTLAVNNQLWTECQAERDELKAGLREKDQAIVDLNRTLDSLQERRNY